MLTLLSDLKDFITTNPTDIDGIVFKLHYRLTAFVLAIFAICVTSFQYIGDPIDCRNSHISADGDGDGKMLDTYCWIHATYTLPTSNKRPGIDIAFPGVDKVTDENRHEVVYHNYYQFVGFVLILQALMFYIPRMMWLMMERHRVHNMTLQLYMPIVQTVDKDDKTKKPKKTGTGELLELPELENRIRLIANYFVDSINTHKFYATGYVICEILSFINVVGQIFLVDKFLGGEFTKYGSEVIKFSDMDQEDRTDPMIRVFPRMTKCTFFSFGSSGDVQKYDALCLLPLNVLNEKIYLICWFWFIILAAFSGFALLRLPFMYIERCRVFILIMFQRYCDHAVVKDFVHRNGIGDWLLLLLFGRNVDAIHFKHVVQEMGTLLGDGRMKRSNSVEMSNFS